MRVIRNTRVILSEAESKDPFATVQVTPRDPSTSLGMTC
jgi:hypothetical protein